LSKKKKKGKLGGGKNQPANLWTRVRAKNGHVEEWKKAHQMGKSFGGRNG